MFEISAKQIQYSLATTPGSQQYPVLLFIITNKFDTKSLLKIFLVLIPFTLDSDKYFGNNCSLVIKNINGI